jgi:hypothetical protein
MLPPAANRGTATGPQGATAPIPNPDTTASTSGVSPGTGTSSGGRAAPTQVPSIEPRNRELDQQDRAIDRNLMQGGICSGCE